MIESGVIKLRDKQLIGVLNLSSWSIQMVFVRLVEKCKKYIRAMRIGTNHGSLSDRIMSYYGDSPRGMAPFEEKHRSYFDFQRRTGDLPVQKEGEEVDYRGLLHRDISVLMSVSLNQLKTPELFYRSLAAKLVLGMPFKEICHGYLKLENTLLEAQLLVLKILKICDFGYSKDCLISDRNEIFDDECMNSLEEAKKLAISGRLDRVVLEANGIFRNPTSVREIKESNLSLLTYGKLNVPEAIHAQYLMGVIVDLVQEITNAVACFKNEDEGAEVKENTNKIEPSFLLNLVSQVMQH
ncbi:putative (E)-4-hydroxy-3-methylbut-2-enyl-diphosphate synthase (ferredoxin) [Helianthus annuus]|nr:putative (E)-4-hydroxy-3-methylbut-2-enyl-diphosphate synthase (ferredoxin) [Helianthus annuus]KAJ0510447.1 putative (E)-4-hydroxy-3-methylbut-2-enyl-diphosphate synthase (ferredoxin) [Helianthus annuus]KAJ0518331.1 putative (E)-4-hydroxy-3-methylbut-2-enyl-diphosphate synthase (ferredoxin) [Helianthus annuus]KAJ0686364.1 putative (E)-4-hydroxy-3-methylbut-2-enyl-diphosphate synthase (ferredoxin) [Helianthus annuus]KAJ0690185.1 putative (E)-4-hydroxy-3-methylbut-2-enyl-diphosphate synthase (